MANDIFQGESVHLRPFEPERESKLFATWNQNSQYMTLLDSGPANLWPASMIKEWIEKERRFDYSFVIIPNGSETPIGMVGLDGLNWSARNAWVGIGIGEPEYWGKGYGTDAMRIILRFAFLELNLWRVNLNVFEYNERAQKSYLKVGFREEGRLRQWMKRDGRRWDLIYMGVLRSDWEALSQA